MRFSLASFAKINWTLRVLGKRDDGFHELWTLFQTVSLGDRLTFEPADTIELTCSDPTIPVDANNLIVKAARLLRERSGAGAGARMHLEKHIPSPGGLGGGSSNAAVTLIGLSRLWNVHEGDLHAVAAELGSDVPFFLYGGTAVGTGRGDVIEPAADVRADEMLIVTPAVKVATKEAFDRLATRSILTSETRESILTVCQEAAATFDPLHSELINDFERSVFAAYPEIQRVKETLLELGAVNAALSGSGASVFAVFDKKETRQAAEKALDAQDHASTWRKFAVSTISRTQYREALGI